MPERYETRQGQLGNGQHNKSHNRSGGYARNLRLKGAGHRPVRSGVNQDISNNQARYNIPIWNKNTPAIKYLC